MFEHHSKQGYCYVWDQTVAAKAAIEVASCLFKFIEAKVADGIKEFIFYSDNCWSQNKNKFVFSMYNMATFRFDIKITHRYLEKGHTHMEVDSIHALIERTSKNIEIFTPSQWYAVMKAAKKTNPRYKVVEMDQKDFKNFEQVADHQKWTKVKVSKVRDITIEKNNVAAKYNYDDVAQLFNVKNDGVGPPVKWKTFRLQQAYF